MDTLSLNNPLFATYVIAAALMILKGVGMSWLTVWRMMREKGAHLPSITRTIARATRSGWSSHT